MARTLVIGISGASGAVYGVRLLEILRGMGVRRHLVMSRAAEMTLRYETDRTPADVRAMADVVHPADDVGAACASGSFPADGMIVAPCSMKTLGEIACGVTGSLLPRAADVTLKERRPLVLLTRETPLTRIHLRNMLAVTEAGGIIAPPVPAFYAKPESLMDMVDHTLGRALDLFGLDSGRVRRWRAKDTAPPRG